MSLALAAIWALLITAALAFVLMFCIALVAAPRKITSGPAVVLARGLFLVGCGCLILAIVALALAVGAGW